MGDKATHTEAFINRAKRLWRSHPLGWRFSDARLSNYRAPKSECFKDEASYGYCAAKDEFYYGFEGHIVINLEGVISGYTFAPANIDERDVLQDMTDGIRAYWLATKVLSNLFEARIGRTRDRFADAVAKKHDWHAPKFFCPAITVGATPRRNSDRSIEWSFQYRKVRARDLWHLTIALSVNCSPYRGCFLNYCLHREPLQLKGWFKLKVEHRVYI